MSRELIALLQSAPEIRPTLEKSEPLRTKRLSISSTAGRTHLFDLEDRLLVQLGVPQKIEVPGELERLLGTTAPLPVWWIEIKAAPGLNADPVAALCANTLVNRYGGTIWNPEK